MSVLTVGARALSKHAHRSTEVGVRWLSRAFGGPLLEVRCCEIKRLMKCATGSSTSVCGSTCTCCHTTRRSSKYENPKAMGRAGKSRASSGALSSRRWTTVTTKSGDTDWIFYIFSFSNSPVRIIIRRPSFIQRIRRLRRPSRLALLLVQHILLIDVLRSSWPGPSSIQ